MSLIFTRRALMVALLPLVLAGCGGGSSPAAPAVSGASRGTATVVLTLPVPAAGRAARADSRNKFPPITLPPYAGNIPFGTNAVRISLTDPATGQQIAASRLVTVPTSGVSLAPQLTVQFNNLPVGSVRITTTAYSDAQGATPPLAVGTADTQITQNSTANVNVTLALTANHLMASTTSLRFDVDQNRGSFTVQVLDSNNMPTGFSVQFLSADPDVADVQSSGANEVLVLRGTVRGTTQIIAYEPNSGLNTIIAVTNN